MDHSLKPQKKYIILKGKEITDIFIQRNWVNLPFNMAWLTEISTIYLEEYLTIKHYVIKYLILPKIQIAMATLFRWIISFLIKSPLRLQINFIPVVMLNRELTKELQKPIIRKFEIRKVYSSFIDNILGTKFCWYAVNE